MTTTVTTRSIKHVFTEDERLEMGRRLSDAYVAVDEAKSRLETFKAQMKGEIKGYEGIIMASVAKLHTGYAMESIECEVINDYEAGMIQYRSLNTDEIVDSRPMTEAERQVEIEFPEESEGEGNEQPYPEEHLGDEDI
jgi:hypothetical protein